MGLCPESRLYDPEGFSPFRSYLLCRCPQSLNYPQSVPSLRVNLLRLCPQSRLYYPQSASSFRRCPQSVDDSPRPCHQGDVQSVRIVGNVSLEAPLYRRQRAGAVLFVAFDHIVRGSGDREVLVIACIMAPLAWASCWLSVPFVFVLCHVRNRQQPVCPGSTNSAARIFPDFK